MFSTGEILDMHEVPFAICDFHLLLLDHFCILLSSYLALKYVTTRVSVCSRIIFTDAVKSFKVFV